MDNKMEDELKLECEMRGPTCTRVLQRNPGRPARVLMKRDVWSALRNIQGAFPDLPVALLMFPGAKARDKRGI